jgi:hypothetical protein
VSDPGARDSDNPLDVLAQAGGRPTRRPQERQERAVRDPGPPTEPVAPTSASSSTSSPPRTSRNLTRPRRTPKPTPPGAKGTGATVTGFILVLVAVVIGLVLLNRGYDREAGLVSAPATVPEESTTTLVPNAPVGNLPGLPSSTNSPLKAPSSVVVKVGKAGAPEGVASADAQKLKNAGYTQSSAFDSSQTVQASKIYFQPGFQGEAAEVAKVFKIPDSAVAPMSNPPPDPLGTPPANILVLLGPEARSESA